jgi:hypothetical protein
MFGRKGQGAMEYLMTYGWAILVVMIVGIVMWQLGIFNIGSTALTSSGFGKLKPQLAGTGLTAGGVFTGVFTNGVGTPVTITSLVVTETMSGGSLCSSSSIPSTAISAGDNFKVEASNCPTGNAGDVYALSVKLGYTVTIGGVSTAHNDSGTIRGPRE